MTSIMDHFVKAVRGRSDATIVEIGANDGYHTGLMANILAGQSLYPWRLIAIEPDPRVFPRLQDDTARHPRVTHYLAAIADTDGYLPMWFSAGEEQRPDRMKQRFSGSSSLMEPGGVREEYPDMTFSAGQVRVHRLDTFCRTHWIESIDFLWADVQGAELRLIAGAGTILKQTRFLYTEFNERSMYTGDAPLERIQKELGDQWALIERYDSEALFRNRQW